jgi:hypothetical protein
MIAAFGRSHSNDWWWWLPATSHTHKNGVRVCSKKFSQTATNHPQTPLFLEILH